MAAVKGQKYSKKVRAIRPDIIILNSVLSEHHEIVKILRWEKGLENALFLLWYDESSDFFGYRN